MTPAPDVAHSANGHAAGVDIDCRGTSSQQCSTSGRECLAYFMHRHLDFRLAETDALLELAGHAAAPGRWRLPHGGLAYSPFWYLTLPSDEVARQIVARSILLKGIVELWGEGETLEELRAAIEAFPQERKAPWLGADCSMKVLVDGWGCTVGQTEQMEWLARLSFIGFQNPVDLKAPDVTFRLIVCSCSKDHGMPVTVPSRLYFGREVSSDNARRAVGELALPKRAYLGPTSMDTEMSLIMCNQAKVRRGDLVFDPFSGTGSILVAAASIGALTLGADIDIRVLRDGKADVHGKVSDNWTNFEVYGLRPPVGLLRLDLHRHPFRDSLEEVVDAVVCDPPYGVRAGGRKSRARPGFVVRDRATHISATDPYCLGECLRDLLDLSARLLRLGGRLVYFMPAAPEAYDDAEVPQHPALALVANTEQVLNSRYSRRLITMQKVRAYDKAATAAYHEERGVPRMAIDRIPQVVMEPLSDAERPKRAAFRSKVC